MSSRWAGFAALILGLTTALVCMTQPTHANDDEDYDLVKIGFRVAPVPLNLRHKDPDLVGLGSYLVNVASDCNGCYTADPATEYAPRGNPYFNQHARVNTATYLGGGQDFGQLISGSAEIVSRNLTPDKTGRPEGGHTLKEFMQICEPVWIWTTCIQLARVTMQTAYPFHSMEHCYKSCHGLRSVT